ncbi:HNH endonuclease signature motif containing protein [Microbacterium oryzae]|nr:HNH endonuclease signature motif containing protein [Microbacterium oryzae]
MVKDASPVTATDPIAGVNTALSAVGSLFPRVEGVADADLVRLTGRVEQLGRIVDALRTRAAGEVSRRSKPSLEHPLSEGFGCRTGRELLERVTGVPGQSLAARARVDERTRERESATGLPLPAEYPVLGAAFAAGLIGVEPVGLLLKALESARRAMPAALRDRVEAMEHHLVGIATGTIDSGLDDATPPKALGALGDDTGSVVPWSVVKAHADAWVDVLTADGIDPDADHEHTMKARTLTVTELPNGAFRVNGTLVPETGALLQMLLSAHTNPARNVAFAPDARDDGPGASDGDATDGASAGPADGGFLDGIPPEDQGDAAWAANEIVHDPRTAGQKRHDAFTAMIQAASRAAETPTLGGAAPTVMVHVAQQDLASAPSDDGPVGDEEPWPPAPPSRSGHGIAHLDGASRAVPVSVARRIGCSGDILRAVFSPSGRILSLISVQRIFTATQRKAIVARDGGCIIPGCTIPAAWCEIHHVQDHALGGATSTDNGVLLCWWHHHHLEQSGWDIQMRNGAPYVAAPNWIDRHHRYRPAPTSTTRLHAKIRQRI